MALNPLRRVLVIDLLGTEYSVDVDFRLLESLERCFGLSCDAIIDLFQTRARVQRRLIADVLAEVLPRYGCKLPRSELREALITAELMQFLVILESLQNALLFQLKQMTAEEFDKVNAELQSTKKKPAPAPESPSSGSATA